MAARNHNPTLERQDRPGKSDDNTLEEALAILRDSLSTPAELAALEEVELALQEC